MLDYVLGHFQVIRHVRPKFACCACDAIARRQLRRCRRPAACHVARASAGGEISCSLSTERDQCARGARTRSLRRCVIGLDKQPWAAGPCRGGDPASCLRRREDPQRRHDASGAGTGRRQTKTGRLWSMHDDRPFCGVGDAASSQYFYSPDRGGEHPASHIAAFTRAPAGRWLCRVRGAVWCGAGYARSITEVACWAHCRRGSSTSGSIGSRRLPSRRSTTSPESMPSRPRPHSPLPAERVAIRTETAPTRHVRQSAEATVAKLSAKSALATAFGLCNQPARSPLPLRH